MRSLQEPIGTAWISKNALVFMVKEFLRKLPNETGGVLVGYWLADSEGAVITDVLGPGPRAKHRKISFVPDASYHESEIARLYEESGRLHTYLGDWHSHPDSTTRLSRTDRHTLLTIAKHAEARVVTPLMAVIGESDPLTLQVWQYSPASVRGTRNGRILALKIREFS
jgi:integrative and conjugative element protein (TIGR02256 family)